MSDGTTVPDFKSYEDGKHRRYELLFAVNGGAFAIAKLLLQSKTDEGNLIVLGNLTLHRLALGMIFLTVVLVFDIYSFGRKMRLRVPGVFGWEGKVVLLSIGCLICAGWFLVGRPGSCNPSRCQLGQQIPQARDNPEWLQHPTADAIECASGKREQAHETTPPLCRKAPVALFSLKSRQRT